jgi:hypothetical protein
MRGISRDAHGRKLVHMPHTPLGWVCACMEFCTLHMLHKPVCAKQAFVFARGFVSVHTLHKPACALDAKSLHMVRVQSSSCTPPFPFNPETQDATMGR